MSNLLTKWEIYGKLVVLEYAGEVDEIITFDFSGVFRTLRSQYEITQEQLAEELDCTATQIYRIEKGDSQPSYAMAEAVLQKLGMDSQDFIGSYLKGRERYAYESRQQLHRLRAERNDKKIRELVSELEGKAPFTSGVYHQFLRFCQAETEEGLSEEERLERFLDVIRLTRKDFDIEDIGTYLLTHNEITILARIAEAYYNIGDNEKAVLISYGVKASMDGFYKDDKEKARTYPVVLYNLSVYLGALERHDEAQEACLIARQNAIQYNNTRCLPSILGAMAYHYWLKGDTQNFHEYLLQAYFTARAQEQFRLADFIIEVAEKEHHTTLGEVASRYFQSPLTG